jgi:rubrerythrin
MEGRYIMADQSKRNLGEAFAGESKANRRYVAFAQVAEEEGFSNVARLFRAVAESETIHAINHMKALGEIKTTVENVEEAWRGEKDEYTSMYPMFIDQAKRDANNDALKSFFWANEAEKTHGEFYEKALGALREGKDVTLGDLHICTVCGYTVEGTPPETCPNCGEGRDKFQLME